MTATPPSESREEYAARRALIALRNARTRAAARSTPREQYLTLVRATNTVEKWLTGSHPKMRDYPEA